MEICAIGEKDTITGFGLAGVRKGYVVSEQKEFESKLNELMEDDNVGLVIVNTKFMDGLGEIMQKKVKSTAKPVIVDVIERGREIRRESMKELIKRAIGVDIIKT